MSSRLDDPDLDLAITSVIGDIVAASPRPADGPAPTSTFRRGPGRAAPTRLLATVASIVAVIAGISAIALVDRSERQDRTADGAGLMIAVPVPVGWPAPGSVVPVVDRTPTGLGPADEATRDGAHRTGDWAAFAIARPHGGTGYTDPITVMMFDGTWSALDTVTVIVADGRSYSSARWNDYEVIATAAPQRVAVAGTVDRSTLLEVMRAVVPDTSQRPYAATLTALPAGYEVIAPLRELADDPAPRSSAAVGPTLVVNEVSDWVDPLLYAATTGADLTRHDVAGSVAWSGTTRSNEAGPLTFLVWAPEPGVVFEVVSSEPRPLDDLIALAEATVATRR